MTVSFNIPYVIDGGSTDAYSGCGLIIDSDKGLVIVDQNTVPLTLSDLMVTFGATIEIPAEVVFVHPIHNFAIIKYDPSLIKNNNNFVSAKLR